MGSPWTIEERAAKWFPVLGNKRIKRGLELMQRVFPLPEDWSIAKQGYYQGEIDRICDVLDVPPSIQGNFHEVCKFLLELQKLMLAKRQFDALRLGMPVMIYDQVGTIVKLDRRRFCATVLLRNFYDALETVSVSEICPLYK